jgi:type VII secretion integral membrane protein EccD
MTSARETDEFRVISAAPQQVRLSFLGSRTQVDVSLPLDVPIAHLAPELVKLAGVGEAEQTDTHDDPFAKEAKHHVWVLSRREGGTPLAPDITLREAGVTEGELLRLARERALSAPTLYDDVVDAAARLHKAGYAGWDATAARWMTFAGVYVASAAWVYFLVADVFAPNRVAMVGLSVAVALVLAGVAALAQRSYAQSDIGAALGWAALPIAAAVAWVALHGLGGYGLAAGCAAMVIVSAALFRAIGTGHWGYLAIGVISGLTGLALAVHTAGVRADLVGCGVALIATLGCLAVPGAAIRFARREPLSRHPERDDATAANRFTPPQAAEPKRIDTATSAASEAASEGVWARVRAETLTRSALYTGLAVSAGLGVWAILTSVGPVQWSGLAFALGCAATLGLYTQRPATAVERAGLAVPAVTITVLSCVLAHEGNQPMRVAAFAALLTAVAGFAAIGASIRAGRLPARLTVVLAYLSYLMTAALIPLALWVVGAYGRWGIA